MNYKTVTLLIFVLLVMLTIYLAFSTIVIGLFIIGAIVPVLVIVQTLAILKANENSGKDYVDGSYENE